MSASNLAAILVIDDDTDMLDALEIAFAGKFRIIRAVTIEEGHTQFRLQPDVAAILIDGCVPGDVMNTEPLTRDLRAAYTGPIIAISAQEKYQARLLAAGCNIAVRKGFGMITELRSILDIH